MNLPHFHMTTSLPRQFALHKVPHHLILQTLTRYLENHPLLTFPIHHLLHLYHPLQVCGLRPHIILHPLPYLTIPPAGAPHHHSPLAILLPIRQLTHYLHHFVLGHLLKAPLFIAAADP